MVEKTRCGGGNITSNFVFSGDSAKLLLNNNLINCDIVNSTIENSTLESDFVVHCFLFVRNCFNLMTLQEEKCLTL